MSIPINKVFSGNYPASKSVHHDSFKILQKSCPGEESSDLNTLRKQPISTLAKSLLQKENQQSKQLTNQRPELKDPRATSMMNSVQNQSKGNQQPKTSSQMQKLEQLKIRFKKIKSSYEQNHKLINSNITNCLQNYKQRCASKQNSSNINDFQILNEDLTFCQSRQFDLNGSIGPQNHNRQISFREEMNPMQHITVNPYENKENYISSANESLSHSYSDSKFRSLSKDLQNLKHGELVNLLIQEIQDNEKNKHVIHQQTQIINYLEKQADQRYSQIPKLKQEIQSKEQQAESKREQMQVLLETQRKNLEIIQKLKKQLQQSSKNDEKTLFFQHSSIYKSNAARKDSSQGISHESIKVFGEKEEMKDAVDYKVKHDELKKYMDEYINNVNEAHEEYRKNMQQLKESNKGLKQSNINLSQEMQESHNAKRQLQNQLIMASNQLKRLSHALGNSKEVINELEQEFLILKDENVDMKTILQRQGSEFIDMKNTKHLMIDEMDHLLVQNQSLHHTNSLLSQEIAEIQQKILNNSEIQTEVRALLSTLTQQKNHLQEQLHKQIQDSEKLTKQLKESKQTILVLKETQKILEERTTTLETRIKVLEQTSSELRQRQEMLQKQNIIMEETAKEMEKLQQELLFQCECEKQQKSKLKSELLQIMNQVNQMQTIYANELSSNYLIKNELSKFLQSQAKNIKNSSQNIHRRQNRLKEDNAQITVSESKQGKLKSQNSAANMSNSEVSFRKNSQMTKEGSGSSSVFRHNHNSDQLCINSRIFEQESNAINASSIADGSRISQKYYSETDEDVQHELQILKSSKKNHININFENCQSKNRQNGRVGTIKNKQNIG